MLAAVLIANALMTLPVVLTALPIPWLSFHPLNTFKTMVNLNGWGGYRKNSGRKAKAVEPAPSTCQDYFLLTNHFLCPLHRVNDKGCGKHYQGSDPWIIHQLPEFVQWPVSAHTVVLTCPSYVMKAIFAGHFGTDPFSKMVPSFSKFEDPLGYAGYALSRKYFKSMFTAWFLIHHGLINRVMSLLSATIIKADHMYKSCLPGSEPINTAMYLIVNSDEEVQAYTFTLIQSFPPLCEVYERMQAELQHHGHPPIQLLYMDNPQGKTYLYCTSSY
ncbi:hypothetical protein B0H14DRAFT_2570547 [Mycena olivaceomarginata]|nr:hypothetical protein B0H14DRAFT_2570547 [Mycena olivaceomarginata]